jgi:long-chain acyl-CoA synthetase
VSVLLTGGTGFIGMEVLARLLAREEDVVVLVRGDADRRLQATLDLLGVPEPQRRHARAVAADLEAPLPRRGLDDVHAIVHAAASIEFTLPLEAARAINVEGTSRVLRLAEGLPHLRRLVHVSTAYVAGRHEGVFRERQLNAGQAFRNTYEQTKLEAEELVHAAQLPAAIARPSIVMGESTTGWTPAFNVLYWPLRAFARGLITAVPARPEARVDIVPVDYVADGLVRLLDTDARGAFHLVAGRDAPTADELMTLAATAVGRERPTLGEATPLAGSERYLPYFDMQVVFDNTRAAGLLGPPPPLATYFPRLVDYAERARWGKRAITRLAA